MLEKLTTLNWKNKKHTISHVKWKVNEGHFLLWKQISYCKKYFEKNTLTYMHLLANLVSLKRRQLRKIFAQWQYTLEMMDSFCLYLLIIFAKKFHHRCLIRFWICLRTYWRSVWWICSLMNHYYVYIVEIFEAQYFLSTQYTMAAVLIMPGNLPEPLRQLLASTKEY